MRDRPVNLRLPVPVQELSLTVFITYMQVQGTIVRNTGEVVRHPLTDFGNLGYLLLIVSGLAVSVRRRWPVPVFAATALASLVYYGLGFPDGPTWLALFLAAYTVAAYGDGRRSLVIVGGVSPCWRCSGWSRPPMSSRARRSAGCISGSARR